MGRRVGLIGVAMQNNATRAAAKDGPELVRPTGKPDGVLDGMKRLNLKQEDVPDWMKPNEDLLKKVNDDKELASGAHNAKITKVGEFWS